MVISKPWKILDNVVSVGTVKVELQLLQLEAAAAAACHIV